MNKEGDFLSSTNANCCSVTIARCEVTTILGPPTTSMAPRCPPYLLLSLILPTLTSFSMTKCYLHTANRWKASMALLTVVRTCHCT